MDRRERYDPEDIEILMQERSFDELLEEERAYVLRHVSDRAEYEAMRSLLIHMRDDARDQEPIEADPAIRANVMQAFRNEQQPQWRIWLNSVGAALFPEEARPCGVRLWRWLALRWWSWYRCWLFGRQVWVLWNWQKCGLKRSAVASNNKTLPNKQPKRSAKMP
jgi:hypothetical protein